MRVFYSTVTKFVPILSMSVPRSFHHIKLRIRDIENIEWVKKKVAITMLTAEFCGSETVFHGVLEDIVKFFDNCCLMERDVIP